MGQGDLSLSFAVWSLVMLITGFGLGYVTGLWVRESRRSRGWGVDAGERAERDESTRLSRA